MADEVTSSVREQVGQSPSFGVLILAFVVGCFVALGVTYLLNLALDGQGSFDNAGGGVVGVLAVVVLFRQFGKWGKGNG